MNKEYGKDLAFVIATNLALLDDESLPEDPDIDRGAGAEDPTRSLACLLRDGQAVPPGYGLYLVARSEAGMRLGMARAARPGEGEIPGPVLRLGPDLAHLDGGDIIHVSEAKLAASVGRPRRLPARACRGGRHTRDSRNYDANLQPPALRPGPEPVALRNPLHQ